MREVLLKGVIKMARMEQDKVKVKEVDKKFLPFIFGENVSKQELEQDERTKVEIFERGLANELSASDTIDSTIEKIVKMALTCEFGATLVTKPGAKKMVSTISRGILSDSQLRKSALIIADRFASPSGTGSKVVSLRGKRKTIING